MREIKFRGRRLDNGEWIYGFYRQYPIFKKCGKCIDHINHFIDYEHNSEFVDPATVGQYTGMKDGAGKEIYEGDVFHYTNEDGYECTSAVRYDEVYGCFSITGSQYMYGVNYAIEHLNANLISNIHDNPELLEPE